MNKEQNERFSEGLRIHDRLLMAFSKYRIFIWVFVVLLALCLVLHSSFGLLWEHRLLPSEQIQKGIGYPGAHAYSIPLRTTWMSQNKRGTSVPAQVLENGVPLALTDSLHADIADKGAGRYSLWGGSLYFSTSDNSDPRKNGRKYEVYWPVPVHHIFVQMIYILAMFMTVFWLLKNIISGRKYAMGGWQIVLPSVRSLFWVSCVVVTLAFVLTRLPWLLDFPLPFISYDTHTYFDLTKQMFTGNWPYFLMRTPGYPIFLALALRTVPKLMFVVILQCALSLCSAFFLLYAIYKTCGRIVIFAAIAVVAHVSQQLLSAHDFQLLTESLFTSFFLFSLGFLFLGTRSPHMSTLLASSFLGGCAILVRPSGIFIFGYVMIACLYLLLARARLKYVLCLILPLPSILLLLMTYNYFTFGGFTMSQISGLTRWGISATFWETDESFPPEINESIKKLSAEISDEDRQIALQSWNVVNIQTVNQKWAAYVIYKCPYIPGEVYRSNPEYYTLVANKAIKAHPAGAIRFFLSTLLIFLNDPSSYRLNMYADIPWVMKQMYIEGTAKDPFIGREFSSFPSIRTLEIHTAPDGQHNIQINDSELRGKQLYFLLARFNQITFDTIFYKNIKFWTVIYFIIFAISFVRVLQTRFRHWGSFITFTTCASLLGAGMVIALTTTMVNRYPSPTRFIEVLSLALVPLLWRKEQEKVSNDVLVYPSGENGMIQNAFAIGDVVRNYCRWNLSVFPIEKKKRILDIGCGPCLYLDAILTYCPEVYLGTDYSQSFLDITRKRMEELPNCRTERLDIFDIDEYLLLLAGQKFDYILCFDVMEHLPDDTAAMKNIREVMSATSTSDLFIRVPALPLIFGKNDEAIGHYRRYTKKSLKLALATAGFEVRRIRYQNIAGVIPWFLIGRLFQRSLAVTPGEGRLFDFFVPALRWIETIVPPPFGLSVYCEATPKKHFSEEGVYLT